MPKTALGNDTDCTGVEKTWFNAQSRKKDIEHFIASYTGRRDLSCLDLFGASGEVKACFDQKGLKSEVYDLKVNGVTNDICDEGGFWTLMTLVCRLKPGSLLMAGPPCSLFIFLSSSVHKRNIKEPKGNTSLASVRLANRIVDNMAAVLDVAHSRGVYCVIEQPGSSQMFRLPSLAKLIAKPHWTRVFTYMGAFKHEMQKPTVLWGTLPTMGFMKRARPVGTRFEKTKSSAKFYIRSKLKNGKKNIQGTKALQGSAAYTPNFCRSIVKTWELAVAA